MLKRFLVIILTVSLITVAGTSTGMAGPHGGHGGGGGGGNDKDEPVDNTPLSDDEVAGLMFMREEEKVARDTYLTLGGVWGLPIFDNIASSEQSHMDALKNLLNKYELPDPVIPGVGDFTDPHLQELYDALVFWGEKSLMDSLQVGAAVEETDMIDIQHAIDETDHEDIISTYNKLMCGSRNHLRAFARQIEANGGLYNPSDEYFEDSAKYFLDIAESPMERDCADQD